MLACPSGSLTLGHVRIQFQGCSLIAPISRHRRRTVHFTSVVLSCMQVNRQLIMLVHLFEVLISQILFPEACELYPYHCIYLHRQDDTTQAEIHVEAEAVAEDQDESPVQKQQQCQKGIVANNIKLLASGFRLGLGLELEQFCD